MSRVSSERTILIDADVIVHFVVAGEADAICEIFPNNPILLLNKVHAELQRWPNPRLLGIVSDLLSRKKMKLVDFPEHNDVIKKEYAWIKSKMFKGDGESACLAVARYEQNILASSNLKDIKPYCQMHKIDYLTTMDFLCEALQTGYFTIDKCNLFLNKVRASGSKLPVVSMADFVCRDVRSMLTL